MKILVFSDSHGKTVDMTAAVKTVKPELILHLGDFVKDCIDLERRFPDIPIRKVQGNCDYYSSEIESDEFVIDGLRLFMCHGHLFEVKLTLDLLINSACIRNDDIVLYGHTHIPYYARLDGIDIINPGSIGSPGAYNKKTYAVLTIENGVVECEIIEID